LQKKIVRALTTDETELLVKKLPADTDAKRLVGEPLPCRRTRFRSSGVASRRLFRASYRRDDLPSPTGRVRDSSNTTADLRRALTDAGFGWVKSHAFRRTAAMRLDQAGLGAESLST